MIESINEILDRKLEAAGLQERSIYLQGTADLGVAFDVDDQVYGNLGDIDNAAVRELIQSAIDEWQAAEGRNLEATGSKERSMDGRSTSARWDWILAFSPLALALLLYAVNPGYVEQIIRRQPPFLAASLPCGWVMTSFVLALMSTCRIIYWAIDKLPWRVQYRRLAKLIITPIFFFPAVFLILLGPAALTMMGTNPLG